MEKVQAGSITETFKFSRALHLMENSGAKCRMVDFDKGEFAYIDSIDGEKEFMLNSEDSDARFSLGVLWAIPSSFVLQNWTMYDERIHG